MSHSSTLPGVDLIIEGAVAANAAYFLHASATRPHVDVGYDGGLLPPMPMAHHPAEKVSFIAGQWTISWVFVHFLVLPFIVFWSCLSAAPLVWWHMNHLMPQSPAPMWTVLWAIGCGIIGLLLLVKLYHALWGRKRKRVKPPKPGTQVVLR